MKLSSAIIVLSLAGMALLETVSASKEQEHGTLRGGVVDEVLQDVRDLGKKKGAAKTSTVDDEKKVAKNEEAKTKKGGGKDNKGGKNKGGGKDNRAGGGGIGYNGPDLPNRAGGTAYASMRSGTCNGQRASIVIDSKASKGPLDPLVGIPGWTDDNVCETDEECASCCCCAQYFGAIQNPNSGKVTWRRVCAYVDQYTLPLNVCVNPENKIPIAGADGGL